MAIRQDLEELLDKGVIEREVFDKLQAYYSGKRKEKPNLMLLVFGVIGAILVGAGLILLIAHNWDDYPNSIKLLCAYGPLILGQLVAAYSIRNKPESEIWKESSAVFLYFAIGACIALVAQIYNISGDAGTFFLTWNLLSLPLVFILSSSVNSLLVIAGLTNYAMVAGFLDGNYKIPYGYSLLVILIIPYYLRLRQEHKDSVLLGLHNWFLAISALCVLPTLMEVKSSFLIIDYFVLFGLFAIVGTLFFADHRYSWFNSFLIIAELGGICLLFILSFDGYWNDSTRTNWHPDQFVNSFESAVSIVFLLVAGFLLWAYRNVFNWRQSGRYILFFAPLLIYCLKLSSDQSMILINLILLSFGIWTIRVGASQKKLKVLNLGLSVISLLIFLRFFDADISFVWRGIIFLLLGCGFFAANYFMNKKLKQDENVSK